MLTVVEMLPQRKRTDSEHSGNVSGKFSDRRDAINTCVAWKVGRGNSSTTVKEVFPYRNQFNPVMPSVLVLACVAERTTESEHKEKFSLKSESTESRNTTIAALGAKLGESLPTIKPTVLAQINPKKHRRKSFT